jgi:hypothetical protein
MINAFEQWWEAECHKDRDVGVWSSESQYDVAEAAFAAGVEYGREFERKITSPHADLKLFTY